MHDYIVYTTSLLVAMDIFLSTWNRSALKRLLSKFIHPAHDKPIVDALTSIQQQLDMLTIRMDRIESHISSLPCNPTSPSNT